MASKLNVKTYTAATELQAARLDAACKTVRVKNFGSMPVWIGTTPDSTKTDGLIKIPGMTAEDIELDETFDTLYIMGSGETRSVEIRGIG